jgi:hypothetical protein
MSSRTEFDESVKGAALGYAGRGWPVLPLAAGSKLPLAGSRGSRGATLDLDEILGWPAGVNVAIATGRPSGIVVLDVDRRHNGDESLAELEGRLGALPKTLEVRTPGGRHLYFTTSADVRNSTGGLGRGLDIKGEGGYVVGVPSVVAGTVYEWLPGLRSIAPLPTALEQPLAVPAEPHDRKLPPEVWAEIVRGGTQEGDRNSTVARLVGHWLAHGLSPLEALELARCVNAQRFMPPLGEGEVARTVVSIAKRDRGWLR